MAEKMCECRHPKRYHHAWGCTFSFFPKRPNSGHYAKCKCKKFAEEDGKDNQGKGE